MAESFDTVRSLVLSKLKQQKAHPPVPKSRDQAKLLGEFIEVSLQTQCISLPDFARRLDIEVELAEALVQGQLPESELDDPLLVDIAAAIRHPVNTVRLLLGKDITPAIEASPTTSTGSGTPNRA